MTDVNSRSGLKVNEKEKKKRKRNWKYVRIVIGKMTSLKF